MPTEKAIEIMPSIEMLTNIKGFSINSKEAECLSIESGCLGSVNLRFKAMLIKLEFHPKKKENDSQKGD